MKKEVLLALKGLQFAAAEEDARALETITPAEYYKRNDSHYIIYDEVMEDFSETVKNTIKIKGSQVEVTKKGCYIFTAKNRTKNCPVHINVHGGGFVRPHVLRDEIYSAKVADAIQGIVVDVDYSLEANYEHMADCKLEMNISPREEMLEL